MKNTRDRGAIRLIGSALLIVLFLVPRATSAAELLFAPTTGTFAADTEFSIKVNIDPKKTGVNASDGKITFDADKLSVSSISKEGSVFSLWTADPSFSNSAGTISFSGGTPTAFTNSGTILVIKFKAKKVGSALMSFGSSTILAADGKGTDVFEKGGVATFEIGSSTPVAPVEAASQPAAEGSSSDGVSPIAPVIVSNTHSKSDAWYATTSANFSWTPTADVTEIRTLFTDKENPLPAALQSQKLALTQKIVASKEGVWFFYVQYKNDFGWGELANKKVQIDTTPPGEFDVVLRADAADTAAPKFAFLSEDALSGTDRYEIIFASSSVATIKAAEIVSGTTLVPPQPGGSTEVTVKAYDKAGNVRVARKTLVLPLVAKPAPKSSEPPPLPPAPIWTLERIITILFALIIGGLIVSNHYTRKRFQEDKQQVLATVLEVRDKNDKVFSAMREEFEQMINNLDEKPQLTVVEREFLENVKEVLDIAEELVDTGIEDLKKKIRGQ